MADPRYYEPVFKDNSGNKLSVVAHSSNFDGAKLRHTDSSRWFHPLS
jgi:hypothetical protein